MVNEVPVFNEVPPVFTSYQWSVPVFAVALMVAVPASQRVAGVVAVMLGTALIVAATAVRDETQPLLSASTK